MITQELETFILEEKEKAIKKTHRYHSNYEEEKLQPNIDLINDITAVILNQKEYENSIINRLSNNYEFSSAYSFFTDIFNNSSNNNSLSLEHPFVQNVLTKELLHKEDNNYFLWNYIIDRLLSNDKQVFDEILNYVTKKVGISEVKIIHRTILQRPNTFSGENNDNYFSKLLIKNINDTELKTVLIKFIEESDDWYGQRKNKLLSFFIQNNLTEYIDDYVKQYVVRKTNSTYDPTTLNFEAVELLLAYNANKYEESILKTRSSLSHQKRERTLSLHFILDTYFPDKYQEEIQRSCEKEINKYVNTSHDKSHYFNYESVYGGDILSVYSSYLFKKDKKKAFERFKMYIEQSDYIPSRHLTFLDEKFQEKAIPLFFEAFKKEPSIVESGYTKNYFETILNILKKYDISDNLEPIILFSIEKANKRNRLLATSFLSTFLPDIQERAFELIKGKKVDERITGALILSNSNDIKVQEQLLEVVDKERNDDTRDVLLEALHDKKFKKPYSFKQVKEMITLADTRKKLNRWGEKWLEEEKLPALYWENGDKFTPTDIRFLFYRIKRAKGLETDIEAKQVIRFIDQNKSDKFVNALLQGFQDSNANSKFKYYLTISGLIGGSNSLAKLHTLFRKTLANKRYRMCEYYVSAIAMIGTNKALRLLDMLSRKFANKRRNIGEAAVNALKVAAKEMNITKDQLSDRIIPDFNMENSYKSFNVDGEEYRAFISKEFKLNYFNPDNKLRKSIPKATPKETVTELKQIQKDINEVVKTQQGKLEQFLINERKWATDEWLEYYYHNPIMLIYVQKLLWGIYDENSNLKNIFYCDEDLSFYDINDDEVLLSNTKHIGIVHPIHMTEDQIKKWKEKVYEINLIFEFPILDRKVTVVQENEKTENYTLFFKGQDIPRGADYVPTFLAKRGWQKENGDGGSLWFYKECQTAKISAHPSIIGPAAWYQGGDVKATIGEIRFQGENYNEKVELKDVPKVFYSEVIADLNALINA